MLETPFDPLLAQVIQKAIRSGQHARHGNELIGQPPHWRAQKRAGASRPQSQTPKIDLTRWHSRGRSHRRTDEEVAWLSIPLARLIHLLERIGEIEHQLDA